jgi:hypothetical protein
MLVTLNGVTDAQRITVSLLNSVTGRLAGDGADNSADERARGDINGSKVVNTSDIGR